MGSLCINIFFRQLQDLEETFIIYYFIIIIYLLLVIYYL